ncbi:helix-turn-helix domain-containing protein [Nocardia sp. CA-129566]|uniref:helix-turn-helix domain-containing protein n=1 Tax=Nocardia sp. CA-129566 TaxID=3239976 RepID=UPI003D96A9EB
MDLALALVEADHGADIARSVAQSLVVYRQRAGQSVAVLGGATRSGAAQPAGAHVADLICADTSHPHKVQTLAAHARISPRHLTQLFRAESESSPAEYVAFIRFGPARDKLHAGYSVTEAAMAAGYGSSEAMRRAFIARLGISPSK